jgi:heme-degrading monooxygenase HmoA
MTFQLRDYRIDPAHLDEFLDAWRRQVPQLRQAHGFEVRAWVVRDEARLVWIVSYPGSREDFEEADAAYYASAERGAFDPDPRRWLVATHHAWLIPAE